MFSARHKCTDTITAVERHKFLRRVAQRIVDPFSNIKHVPEILHSSLRLQIMTTSAKTANNESLFFMHDADQQIEQTGHRALAELQVLNPSVPKLS